MQVAMEEVRNPQDAKRREHDLLVAQTKELLSTSEEFRERVDRAVAEAMRKIDWALARMRRGY